MDINTLANDLDTLSRQYCKTYGFERTPEWLLLKLGEEVGELMQAYLKFTGQTRNTQTEGSPIQALEDEMADVLGMILLVAQEFNLNIERGLQRKWLRHGKPAVTELL